MDIHALCSLAETNHHFSFLAGDVFRRKFSRKLFYFEDPLPMADNGIKVFSDKIIIRNVDVILRVLEHFGHLIPKISMQYNQYRSLGLAGITNIIQSINSHCSDTLIEFDLKMCPFFTFEFFDQMTNPFRNVKTLSITGQFKGLSSSNLQFNELFPAVQRLTFGFIQMPEKMSLNQYFPHLKHLYVEISQSKEDLTKFTEKDVQTLFKNNPQINSLKLGRSSLAFLKTVSETLPDLENLSLESLYNGLSSGDNVEILFKHLKKISIDDNMSHIPESIQFGNLSEFDMVGSPLSNGEWIQFLTRNPHLKKLTIKRGYTKPFELQTLIEMNLNITEISLMLNATVEDDIIIKFIKKYRNMKKIHFTRDYSLRNVIRVLLKDRTFNMRITGTEKEVLVEQLVE